MSKFYCRNCGASEGWNNFSNPSSLTGTPYQLDKFNKHINSAFTYNRNSIFNDPSYSNYSGLVGSAMRLGCYEQDAFGRINLVWDAGKQIGETLYSGIHERTDDSVKVVLYPDPHRIHAAPTASNLFRNGHCSKCGQSLT